MPDSPASTQQDTRPAQTWAVEYQPRTISAFVRDPDGNIVADVYVNDFREPSWALARARLIAASPDLLAALKAALEQTEDGLHYSPDCDVPDCWVEMARATIAAAEGREPQP